MGRLFLQLSAALFSAGMLFFCILPVEAQTYPKKANYYLRWHLDEGAVQELAKWDLVILDAENQISNPDMLRRLRQLNPNITILAYFTAQDIRADAGSLPQTIRAKYAAGLASQWYLKNLGTGNYYSAWPGMLMLNMADNAPLTNGQRLNNYAAHFVSKEILSTGLWDGIFYDNTWQDVVWFAGKNIDLNADGQVDNNIDTHWREGVRFLYNETRRITSNRYLIVGNGSLEAYKNDLNGIMLENFPNHNGWQGTMDVYFTFQNAKYTPGALIVNRTTLNKGTQNDFRSMRFGLTSALLGDGYYSFDYGDQAHEQTWWYDEYDQKLGEPLGDPISVNGKLRFQDDVWRRDFSRGVVLVNTTGQKQTVFLDSELEKIIGKQDPGVNDGSIVDSVTLAPKDGIILLKPFKSLQSVLFANGVFARFYNDDGKRARNGFFVFEDGLAGGVYILNYDLDGNGRSDRIVITKNKLQIFNERGEIWFSDYPFGGNHKGKLAVSVGSLWGGGEAGIVVSSDASPKLIVYNYHGGLYQDNILPFGKNYKGGLSVAVGNFGGDRDQIIMGTRLGVPTEIAVLNNDLKTIKTRFFPFDRNYRGGVSLAAGNVDAKGVDDILAVGKLGTKNIVRIFTSTGRKIKEFAVSNLFRTGPLGIGSANIDSAGKDEIVIMSQN